ncbi:MAG: hypothetical protein K8S23_01040 [Candidatus Cloacimonetes bacterium]|nr:hypothetical protein [Candidatus Cloacimonadota bacterium]
MSKKSLYIIVLISLAFNISFFGMFAYHRFIIRDFHHRNVPRRPHNLEARDKFREIMEDIKPMQMEFHKIRQDFIMYLSSNDFDEETAFKILDGTLHKQIDMEREIGIRFINLRKEMKNEQAGIFFKNLPGPKNRPFRERINRKIIQNRRKK